LQTAEYACRALCAHAVSDAQAHDAVIDTLMMQ